MFKVPVVKNGVNGHLRQKGKIAELALGYGGSVGALKSMGALEMGLTEEELQPLVDSWRNSNPMITAFWWDVDNAVKDITVEYVPYASDKNFGYTKMTINMKAPVKPELNQTTEPSKAMFLVLIFACLGLVSSIGYGVYRLIITFVTLIINKNCMITYISFKIVT